MMALGKWYENNGTTTSTSSHTIELRVNGNFYKLIKAPFADHYKEYLCQSITPTLENLGETINIETALFKLKEYDSEGNIILECNDPTIK